MSSFVASIAFKKICGELANATPPSACSIQLHPHHRSRKKCADGGIMLPESWKAVT